MNTDYAGVRTADSPGSERRDGNGMAVPSEVHYVAPATGVVREVPDFERKDLIRWGPILAGVVTALAVMLFLTVLGIALGLSAFNRDQNLQAWGTAAGIWGGLSALLAFFFGGWMAGRGSYAGPDRNGVLNGFVAGATTLILLLWLATSTLTGVLGFFATNVTNLAAGVGAAAPAALDAANVETVPAASDAADQAVADPAAAVDEAATNAGEAINEALPADPAAAATEVVEDAAPGAWGTVIAILLALGAAVLGGVLGQANRVLVPGSRGAVTT